MESEYKIIKYEVFNNATQESVSFEVTGKSWLEVRSSAIDLAVKWKTESSEKTGISINMIYGIESNPDHTFIVNILSTESLSTSEALHLLTEEITALEYLGYQFEQVNVSDSDGNEYQIVSDKHAILLELMA